MTRKISLQDQLRTIGTPAADQAADRLDALEAALRDLLDANAGIAEGEYGIREIRAMGKAVNQARALLNPQPETEKTP